MHKCQKGCRKMKRFKLEIQETVVFRHEIIVEVEDACIADKIADEIENSADDKNDFEILCEDKGGKLIDLCEDGSGEAEFECTDLEEVNESEEEQ